jgi:hypothetical protein
MEMFQPRRPSIPGVVLFLNQNSTVSRAEAGTLSATQIGTLGRALS